MNRNVLTWIVILTAAVCQIASASAQTFSHPGKYAVKIETTTSFEGINLSLTTTTETGVARITSTGYIYYISSVGSVQTGYIGNIGLPIGTTAPANVAFDGVEAMSTFKNSVIRFSATSYLEVGGVGTFEATATATTEYIFTRTGN
jgi:hypothetical protein